MVSPTTGPQPPDGIEPEQIEPRHGLGHHASLLSIGVLGAIVALGVSGFAGGRISHLVARGEAAEMTLTTPRVVRSGDILETRLQVVARQRIGKLVIGVERGLWREVTTNSMVPAAGDESHGDGFARFAFGPLEAGRSFEWQVAQQINPSLVGRNRGRVVVFDGERPLAETTVTMEVLP